MKLRALLMVMALVANTGCIMRHDNYGSTEVDTDNTLRMWGILAVQNCSANYGTPIMDSNGYFRYCQY
jgi:hypothetical protein